MNRETELLIKGANVEIVKILRNFDEIINARLGEETWLVDENMNVIPGSLRKTTLQDRVELLENEWTNTVEQLGELGIEIEEIESPKEINDNHKKVHEELEEYLLTAAQNDETSFLEFNNIQIPFDSVSIKNDRLGNMLTLSRYERKENKGDFTERMVAQILLKKGVEYIVEDKTGTGYHPLIIENNV